MSRARKGFILLGGLLAVFIAMQFVDNFVSDFERSNPPVTSQAPQTLTPTHINVPNTLKHASICESAPTEIRRPSPHFG